MFSEYKIEVVKSYEKKKIEGILPINLKRPTPAKLRDEWLLVIQENYTPQKDNALLRTFFGHKASINEYITCIKKLDPDKFRPLINFLKEKTKETDEKNIELLAWLIDFKDRPFQFNLNKQPLKESENFLVDDKGKAISKGNIDELGINPEIKTKSEEEIKSDKKKRIDEEVIKNPENYRYKYLITSFGLTIMLVFGLIYRDSLLDLFNKNQCMYWNGKNYQEIACDVKIPNLNAIALDTFKLKHFRKILKPDTLTYHALGKTWYLKMDNKVEFFTNDGYHPVHTEKQVKGVTKYIIDKYALKKEKTLVK